MNFSTEGKKTKIQKTDVAINFEVVLTLIFFPNMAVNPFLKFTLFSIVCDTN